MSSVGSERHHAAQIEIESIEKRSLNMEHQLREVEVKIIEDTVRRKEEQARKRLEMKKRKEQEALEEAEQRKNAELEKDKEEGVFGKPFVFEDDTEKENS